MYTKADRGVSPVVGVILMVAITVILAAVIGTFVLDLGSDVDDPPTASVSYKKAPAGGGTYTADIQVISVGDVADFVTVTVSEASGGAVTAQYTTGGAPAALPADGVDLNTVGDSLTLSNLEEGDQVTVLATRDQSTVVIKSDRI